MISVTDEIDRQNRQYGSEMFLKNDGGKYISKPIRITCRYSNRTCYTSGTVLDIDQWFVYFFSASLPLIVF
jgi:hypothetical protein